MMDIQLRDYQLDCLDKVMSKINDGARHLSVVMTVGLGQKTTSLFLAKKLILGNMLRLLWFSDIRMR